MPTVDGRETGPTQSDDAVMRSRGTVHDTVTMPDGTVVPFEYRGSINTGRGNRKEREAREAAEAAAIAEWEANQGREDYWNRFETDYFSDLDQYLPDYDQLLDRTGSSYTDIVGGQSQQAQALGQGADQFQDIYDQGGYTDLERGQIDQGLYRANAGEKAQRDAQMQQMRMRGMGGSGLEAMSGMNAQQQGANRGLASATGVATQAQERALNALSQGTQMRGQQGQAADAFNQAHLGWQDYQQGLQGQWQQQALQNQDVLAQRLEGQRRYQMDQGRQLAGADVPEGSSGMDGPQITQLAADGATTVVNSVD